MLKWVNSPLLRGQKCGPPSQQKPSSVQWGLLLYQCCCTDRNVCTPLGVNTVFPCSTPSSSFLLKDTLNSIQTPLSPWWLQFPIPKGAQEDPIHKHKMYILKTCLLCYLAKIFFSIAIPIFSDFPCFKVCVISHQTQNVECGSEFINSSSGKHTIPHC